MGAGEQRSTVARTTRRTRSIACLTFVAILSLWTLGTLHAAEHDAVHDNASCGTCVAVAADGLVGSTTLALDAHHGIGVDLVRTHEDPAAGRRVLRLSARAPPTPRA